MFSNKLSNKLSMPRSEPKVLLWGNKNMARRVLKEKNIRKLTRMGRAGSSLGLTIPKEITTQLGWKERQKVVVKKIRGGLVIRDWKKR